jgi:hypothetical protein
MYRHLGMAALRVAISMRLCLSQWPHQKQTRDLGAFLALILARLYWRNPGIQRHGLHNKSGIWTLDPWESGLQAC